tara:strand:+ start:3452 stop:4330 length:879 start_codon:yes stop_codon:yes gene_type:complete
LKIKIKLFIIFVLLSSCKKEIDFDLQGHRGYRGLYPENSIQGFIKSLEIGVNTLELDVIISRDNKVVVSHEPWMSYHICLDSIGNKISDDKKKYNLYEMDYNDIRKFDCGIIGNEKFPEQNKISTFKPTLNHTINIIEEYAADNLIRLPNYNIEIKSKPSTDSLFHPGVEEFSDLVVSVIDSLSIFDRVTIQSFDFRILRYINKKYPKISLSVLVSENHNPSQNIKDLGFLPKVYSPYYENLNYNDVKFLKNKKIKIIPWTVNSYSDIAKILDLNIDGIISDYPERVLKIRN